MTQQIIFNSSREPLALTQEWPLKPDYELSTSLENASILSKFKTTEPVSNYEKRIHNNVQLLLRMY